MLARVASAPPSIMPIHQLRPRLGDADSSNDLHMPKGPVLSTFSNPVLQPRSVPGILDTAQ